MATATTSAGQQYYERVEALKAEGLSNADAIRTVAEKTGKTIAAVRGGLHQHKARHGIDGIQPRGRARRAASVDDLLAGAREQLQNALARVDQEVSDSKTALDAAQARYEQIAEQAGAKKTDIQKKLKALA